ncbi:hypothetical protein [Streptomyces sp. NPDC056144]|uniref:hypothetical protein n=1 Tax=unclassified Streptomyces TaxID=2593676 RepID=UPI0035DCA0E3
MGVPVQAVVRQAVHDVRTPLPPPAEPPANSFVTAGRTLVDEFLATRHEIGELVLTVASG